MSDFLPADYTPPASISNYLRFEKGETKFRFVTSPITGWVWFTDAEDGKRAVHRLRATEKAPEANLGAKHFWAAVVWDYEDKQLKILEIKQKTIQTAILALSNNKAWGNPKDYDICITRTGDKLDTEYQVMPEPKTPVNMEWLKEAKNIRLEALYGNEDPFAAKLEIT